MNYAINWAVEFFNLWVLFLGSNVFGRYTDY